MTPQQAIQKIFSNKTNKELSEIWQKVFLPEASSAVGKVVIHPVILDDLYIKEYGQYDGAFGEDIKKRFGEEVLTALTQ